MEQRSESNGRKYGDMKIPKTALSLLILMRVCSVSLDALLLGSGWEEREQMRSLSCGSIYRMVTLTPSDTNNSLHSLVIIVLKGHPPAWLDKGGILPEVAAILL